MTNPYRFSHLLLALEHNSKALAEIEADILGDYPTLAKGQAITVSVYYEAGYQWSIKCNNSKYDNMFEEYSSMTKIDALKIAKHLAKENGWNLIIQTLTKQERREMMQDRWDQTKAMGYDNLAWR